MEPSTTGQVGRQRAQAACNYCRKRKMRCSNDYPKCVNCQAFNQECVYTQSSKKKRSGAGRHRTSEVHVTQLEQENQNLRMQLATSSTRPTSPDHARQPSFSNVSSAGSSTARNEAFPPPLTRAYSSPPSSSTGGEEEWRGTGGEISSSMTSTSTYLGMTPAGLTPASVLVHTQERGGEGMEGAGDAASKLSMGDRNTARQRLETEAGIQRRQEAANYYRQTLDFDGVDPDLGMHLLYSHWNRQHHSYLITYRPAFMRDMACQGPYFSKLLLNAIYFSASKFSPRLEVRSNPNDIRTAGAAFRQRTKELLVPALEKSEVTTIQALLLLARSLFALGEGKSVAWMYAGIAMNMIIDLDMHTDELSTNAKNLTDEDLEIRRRVFWAAFVIDKIQSLCQGRPLSLQWNDCHVPLIVLDQYEENELWQPLDYPGSRHYPQTPTYSVSTFTNLCKLCIIMNDVLNTIYAKRRQEHGLIHLKEDTNNLQRQIDQWYQRLDDHLKFDPSDTANPVPPPSVLSLLCMYHVLVIQLHYPLTISMQQTAPQEADVQDSFAICSNAAKQIVLILQAYNQTFSIRKAPYLIAYATYVSATIHVRDAARRLTAPDTMMYLRRCLNLLDINQETNPGIEKAKGSLSNLMNRLNVFCPVDQGSFDDTAMMGFTHTHRSSSADTPPHMPGLSAGGGDMPTFSRTPTMDTASNAGSVDHIPEHDRMVQDFTESQMSGSMGGHNMISPYPDTGFSVTVDYTASTALESLLLDPVGIDYHTNALGSVESLDLNAGIHSYDWPDPMT